MGCFEATVELERTDCLVTSLVFSKLKDASVGRLSIGKETSLHRVVSDDILDVITPLRQISKSVRKVGKDSLWVESKSCSACRFLSERMVPVISSRTADETHVHFRLLVQSRKALQSLVEEMKAKGLKPRVVDITENRVYEMTDREKQILLFAFNHGYFESQRVSSLTEIARILEVSPSSLSDVMRRALKKVVADYLKKSM
ncbi:MAG: helix-turn-helix domain-containing protein [Thermoplasmata archaeon]|uniref:Helix-turn-helix domain-containing protein n=1 Tax=Candidatus Sysuiplasma superficiale TaxID=2823368 RepID=A0A8J8CG71_9ARCH|nr:helix-turn-helix domain-containing protein [Candidatus Sysuiplasma superficiale]MBX8644036.1 helix-turn-helix domain-containing protein [Candidatus Sysuiplasma superficiale]MCL5437140.1 helix-turn-helix domain-containing protein [Candidatus Thermoplasmatota archaeon]